MKKAQLFAGFALFGALAMSASAAETAWWSVDFDSKTIEQITNAADPAYATGQFARDAEADQSAIVVWDKEDTKVGTEVLKLDTQGTDLSWTPVAASGTYNTVYIDSDIYFVGSDTEPSAAQFDSAEAPVQTAIFLKNTTDDQGNVTASTLCAYSFDIETSANVWRELPNAGIADNSWAHIRVTVDYSGGDPTFSVFVDGVRQGDANGTTSFTIANPGSFEGATLRKLNSVAFRGTGAVDNFAGSFEDKQAVTYTLASTTYFDGTVTEEKGYAIDPVSIPEGTASITLTIPKFCGVETSETEPFTGTIKKLILTNIDGTVEEFTLSVDVESPTFETTVTSGDASRLDTTDDVDIYIQYATTGISANPANVVVYYESQGYTPPSADPVVPSISGEGLPAGTAPVELTADNSFVVRFVAPEAGVTYTLQAAGAIGSAFADTVVSKTSSESGEVIELVAPPSEEPSQFFRVKASR